MHHHIQEIAGQRQSFRVLLDPRCTGRCIAGSCLYQLEVMPETKGYKITRTVLKQETYSPSDLKHEISSLRVCRTWRLPVGLGLIVTSTIRSNSNFRVTATEALSPSSLLLISLFVFGTFVLSALERFFFAWPSHVAPDFGRVISLWPEHDLTSGCVLTCGVVNPT